MGKKISIRERKLLICLYEKLNRNNNLIINELVKKELNLKEKDVNAFIKENCIDINDYCCYGDKDFPIEKANTEKVVLIFKKEKMES